MFSAIVKRLEPLGDRLALYKSSYYYYYYVLPSDLVKAGRRNMSVAPLVCIVN